MKKILIITLALLFFWQNSMAQWDYLGLKNKKVNALRIQDNYLYAATDSGLFRKNILLFDTIWTSIGFQNKRVNDIYTRDTNFIYAGVQISGIGADTITLFGTHNGGTIWDPLWGEYDNDQFSYVYIDNMQGVKDNSDTIIINAGGLRKSIDGGLNFIKVNYQGGRFLTVAPGNPNIIWTGGEGVFLNPYLIQSNNGGDNWFYNDSLQQIVSGDNACLSADIHPTNSDIIYVGMEGQIGHSNDNGSNWIKIGMHPYYIKAVKISPTNYATIYASGGMFGGTDIPLFISNNQGSIWDTIKYNIGTQTDALELTVKKQPGIDLIFIGTRQNGVYKYQNAVNSIYNYNNQNNLIFKVYPNPFSQQTTLEFEKSKNNVYTLMLFDGLGRPVYSITEILTNKVEIERNDLPSGLYFFQLLSDKQEVANGKLILE